MSAGTNRNNRTIFLYSNQPVVCCGGRYYTRMRNFIDFLSELALQDDSYHLIVPCKTVDAVPDEALRLDLPENVIRVSYYEQHWEAFAKSLANAFRVRSEVKKALELGEVVFAGPALNSFLFMLSLIIPSRVSFAFFIRGDKVEMLGSLYRGAPLFHVTTGLARLFSWKTNSLLAQSRAKIFLYNEKMRDRFKAKESDLHVIAPLIDGGFVRNDQRPEIPPGRPLRVLYLGRLSGEKNVMALVDACAAALARKRPFTLTIAGHGPLSEEVGGKIGELGIGGFAEPIGYVKHGEELSGLLDSHDLLCLPSFTEATPRVVIESFARGLPVVSTRVGSLPHLFSKEVKFIEGFSSSDILSALLWCDFNREALSGMGRAGMDKIRPFIIEENVKLVDRVLRDCGQPA